MPSLIYEADESEIEGDACAVTGKAVFDVTWGEFFDRDIGGSDGREATGAELIRFELDAVHLTREQVELIMGKSGLLQWEDYICTLHNEAPEMLEAA